MEPQAHSRRFVYRLLIAIAFAMACGRILCSERLYEPSMSRKEGDPNDKRSRWPAVRPLPMPTYGSNDRSRWATVRAMVDEGTFVVGKRDRMTVVASAMAPLAASTPRGALAFCEAGYQTRIKADSGIIFEDGWQSVDKVLHPSKLEFYSTKPPLLSVLMAGLYWLLQMLTGWTLAENPNDVVRSLLLLVNGVSFAGYLWLLSRLVDRYGSTEWGRLFVLAAGAFGTFVHPFLVTFNNHTMAVFSVMGAWVLLLNVWRQGGDGAWWKFFTAGVLSAFAAANELPSLSFAAAAFGLMLFWRPSKAILGFLLGAALVAGASFWFNYQAIGQLRPAYSEFGRDADTSTGLGWYEFEGSHWRLPPKDFLDTLTPEEKLRFIKSGIDFARFRETRAEYAFHCLVGHHGVYSLTPIWIFSTVVMVLGALMVGRWLVPTLRPPSPTESPGVRHELPPFVAPLGLVLTVVVIGFYLVKSDNYGGYTLGLRWLTWLTPIWLTALIPAADWLAKRSTTRVLAMAFLAVSVFSASYTPWTPWHHPWIFDLITHLGWKGY